ncbi:MAG: adenosylcobalamin-dependent ribonucleoside-diphosphate reductase [Hyphomicrobiaceae bacterium]
MRNPSNASVLPLPPISMQIWDSKYRLKAADGTPIDRTLEDTWRRVARAGAAVERTEEQERWSQAFFEVMRDLLFLPAGRIIAGAGSGRDVTLFNCFVMGEIEDDLASIFDQVKEAALTMQRGGGIGHDFSGLRPAGALVRSVGAGASGPVSFMDVWDAMCRTIMSAGQRRGAMMGTLRCDHPDIEAFIDAKKEPGRLRNFNLSVLVTDAFMSAVREDGPWALRFGGEVVREVKARELWARIMQATYAYAEPGVIFIDRINARNNLAYCETITATNPCGEQPLPPYGACLLGSINLARLVQRPFEADAQLDESKLAEIIPVAVRFLDNVIDISAYPLEAQRREAVSKRRVGLGITGLGNALSMLGVRYGDDVAQRLAARWMGLIERHAYLASAKLAEEKGAFAKFEHGPFLSAPNVAALDPDVKAAIAEHGIRNGCLTSIAPTGTISLLAGNVSSGIEPVFDHTYQRRIRGEGESFRTEVVEDHGYRVFRQLKGDAAELPASLVSVADLDPQAHLAMQAAVQRHVDSSISKTINCPQDISFEAFREVYAKAYEMGLKGCTTFRPNAITGSVLSAGPKPEAAPTRSSEGLDDHAGVVSRGVDGAGAGVGASVEVSPAAPGLDRGVSNQDAAGVVYMSRPLEREPVLAGFTYKLKWADSEHAIYVTINDIERDGRRRPFEIFINTKNLEHYAWTVALTRMISAVFRRGGDVSFVVEELKAVFDPQGGQWMDGRYVPSLLAAIGGVIENHLIAIGFLQGPLTGDGGGHDIAGHNLPDVGQGARDPTAMAQGRRGRRCPKCGLGALVLQSGCLVCRDCGYSRCG